MGEVVVVGHRERALEQRRRCRARSRVAPGSRPPPPSLRRVRRRSRRRAAPDAGRTGVAREPHAAMTQPDHRQVGEAVGAGLESGLQQAAHGDEHDDVPEPTDEQIRAAPIAAHAATDSASSPAAASVPGQSSAAAASDPSTTADAGTPPPSRGPDGRAEVGHVGDGTRSPPDRRHLVQVAQGATAAWTAGRGHQSQREQASGAFPTPGGRRRAATTSGPAARGRAAAARPAA